MGAKKKKKKKKKKKGGETKRKKEMKRAAPYNAIASSYMSLGSTRADSSKNPRLWVFLQVWHASAAKLDVPKKEQESQAKMDQRAADRAVSFLVVVVALLLC